MSLAAAVAERERAEKSAMPINAAELAELDLLYRRKGAELGLCGFGFARDCAAGPRQIRLFVEDAAYPSLTLTKHDGGEYLLSRGRSRFPLPAISALARILPWLRTKA